MFFFQFPPFSVSMHMYFKFIFLYFDIHYPFFFISIIHFVSFIHYFPFLSPFLTSPFYFLFISLFFNSIVHFRLIYPFITTFEYSFSFILFQSLQLIPSLLLFSTCSLFLITSFTNVYIEVSLKNPSFMITFCCSSQFRPFYISLLNSFFVTSYVPFITFLVYFSKF